MNLGLLNAVVSKLNAGCPIFFAEAGFFGASAKRWHPALTILNASIHKTSVRARLDRGFPQARFGLLGLNAAKRAKNIKTTLKAWRRVPLDKSEGLVKQKLSLAMRKHRCVGQRVLTTEDTGKHP